MNQMEALAPKQRDGLFDPSRMPTSQPASLVHIPPRESTQSIMEIKSGSDTSTFAEEPAFTFLKN